LAHYSARRREVSPLLPARRASLAFIGVCAYQRALPGKAVPAAHLMRRTGDPSSARRASAGGGRRRPAL